MSADDISLQSGGGGGTMDGMNERIIRLEERTDLFSKQLDRIVTRLDAMDAKFDLMNEKLTGIAKLPSKEFLIGSLTAVLAIALAIAALTFTIADYAAKKAALPAPTQATAPAPQQQPMIIVVPSLPAAPSLPQPAPVAPPAPTP
ncbi:MAG: hypothetical protein ACKOBC_10975 [Hyphomicrobiales bacterium]